MLGTIVNTGTILAGSMLGSVLRKGVKEKYQNALYTAMGLAATALGINAVVSNMPKSNYPVLFIVSLAVGSLLGTILDLDGKFQGMVGKYSKSNLGQGLSTGILLYCIGTLSILGPVMSALYGDNTYLFTNATLDFVTSTVLASTYGIGMAFAAPVLHPALLPVTVGADHVLRITGEQVIGVLESCRSMFDTVRLVDPEICMQLTDTSDGAVVEKSEHCYAIWNKT